MKVAVEYQKRIKYIIVLNIYDFISVLIDLLNF
jgi:hypothetical protein